jgi:hypothetical protein
MNFLREIVAREVAAGVVQGTYRGLAQVGVTAPVEPGAEPADAAAFDAATEPPAALPPAEVQEIPADESEPAKRRRRAS